MIARAAVIGFAALYGLAVSFGAAMMGEPSAVWLWSDMLGILR